ncbi:MAG: inositol-3-phosphate synthase [Candidatus ainarchaeum sp.]|jgi:myo-inositol-1-phosphate synthase|nr:inositol-3-phosphate synthase [Candidatus ainarchaeum sp.]
MSKIKIGIIGVGNCASSLVQGLNYYLKKDFIGLLHPNLKGYSIKDIDVVCAIDVDQRKVGKPISKAIFSRPNCTTIFCKDIKEKVIVQMGPILDGLSGHVIDNSLDKKVIPSTKEPVDIINLFKKTKPDFVICYLPVGSSDAVKFYADAAIKANVGFINAMPVFIASDKKWIDKFKSAKLLVFGDDVKSQIGATIIHRVLVNLFLERGCLLKNTYQLNIGGNTDFLNMMNKERLKLKWESKINSVNSQYDYKLNNLYAGPAEYIHYLNDNKIAYINLRGLGFGGQPIDIELKLSVTDSPNSAGVIIDIIRLAKIAKDRNLVGTVPIINNYGFKTNNEQYTDDFVFKKLKKWIYEK